MSYSIVLSLICLFVNKASAQLDSLLKPNFEGLSCLSTVCLTLCCIIFAKILPAWFNSKYIKIFRIIFYCFCFSIVILLQTSANHLELFFLSMLLSIFLQANLLLFHCMILLLHGACHSYLTICFGNFF